MEEDLTTNAPARPRARSIDDLDALRKNGVFTYVPVHVEPHMCELPDTNEILIEEGTRWECLGCGQEYELAETTGGWYYWRKYLTNAQRNAQNKRDRRRRRLVRAGGYASGSVGVITVLALFYFFPVLMSFLVLGTVLLVIASLD